MKDSMRGIVIQNCHESKMEIKNREWDRGKGKGERKGGRNSYEEQYATWLGNF